MQIVADHTLFGQPASHPGWRAWAGSILAEILRRLRAWQARRAAAQALRGWSDAELKDIGLIRSDIDFALRRRTAISRPVQTDWED